MVQANMDRRTFVEALGALGALSIAGVGIGSQPSVAVAAESAFPPPQPASPSRRRWIRRRATCPSTRT
ncbi:MAG: hypothetical protein V8S24_05890 [Gordonibacter pamelaeae]